MGRIGLAAFLNKVRVLDHSSPQCRCGRSRETAAHVIAHYPLYIEARRSLCNPEGLINIKKLVSTAKGAKRLIK